MPTRFRDSEHRIEDFSDHMLVVCPRCGGRADVLRLDGGGPHHLWWPRKLVCARCGHAATREQIGRIRFRQGGYDWYFDLPLWLRTDCRGEILWAFNARHLDFLERYIGSKLRERTPSMNKSLASRLPPWMKSAKSRDDVVRCIRRPRDRLSES